MAIGEFPDANYTPTMAGYSGQGSFRFWCQTVLPLVYDDSLSYYELLNKVVVYLNNVISDVSNVETNVDALLNAYNSLQEYVNTYFDSLDVQEEINSKLDEMAESGELNTIIDPVIAEEVGDWLGEHITPTTPALDNTLSVANAAAESKAVGDAVNGALTYRGQLASTDDLNDSEFAVNGQWYYSAQNIPLNAPFNSGAGRLIVFGLKTESISGRVQMVISTNVGKFAWRMGYNSTTFGAWHIYSDVDTTLAISGAPADSKTVGDVTDGVLTFKGSLTDEDDIDSTDFCVNGQWYYSSTEGYPTNCPFDSGLGRLICFGRSDDTYLGRLQIIYNTSARKILWRFRLTDSWSTWYDYADNSSVFVANVKALTTTDDLYSFTQAGSYSKASGTNVAQLPKQTSGYVYKFNKLSTPYLIYHNSNGEIWSRQSSGNYPWHLVSPGNSFGYRLTQKTIMGIGGSWVKQANTSSVPESAQWFRLIVDKFAMTGYNNGLASSSFAKYDNEVSTSVVERIPTIITAHTNTETDIANGTQYPGTSVDYIILQGGGNDSSHNVPLGNIDSTTDTDYYGALNIIVNALRGAYPTARIGFVTCFRRWVDDSSVSANGNNLGLYDEDYANALVTFCRANSIPCYDAWHNSNIIGRWGTAENPNYWPYISSSNKHLNSAGNAYVAPIIAQFLNEI